MKKTILVTCAAILGVMLVLPWLTVRLIQSGMAMAFCLLLFFCVDPLCAVFTGVTAGKHLRVLWWVPLCNAAAFLAGTWICFDPGETAFLLYAAVYFVLGIAAMILSAWIHK